MLILRQSTAIDIRMGPFVDVADGATPETGITLGAADQAEVLKENGAATVAMAGTFAAITGADGWYDYTVAAGDVDTVGEVVFVVQDVSVCLPVYVRGFVVEEAVYDAMYDAASAGPLQSTTAGRTLDVSATGEAGLDWANIGSPTTAQNLSGTNIDVDQVVASVSGAVGSVTAAVTVGTINANVVNASALATDAAEEIADTVWDEDATGHQTTGTFGQAIGDPVANTETIYDAVVTDAAGINVATDIIAVKAETALIVEDTGTTIPGTITTLQADTDDIQTRLPAALVGGAMDSDVSAIQAGAITAAAIANGAIDAATFAAGAIDAAAVATDAIDADALAADAVTEIRDAILPVSNTTLNNIPVLFVAASDHVTPVTGATGTAVTRSIDGGAFGAGTGSFTEIANGMYQYDASAADMNGGIIIFRFTATGGTPGAPDDAFVTVVTGAGV
jgi:hypothetical protein